MTLTPASSKAWISSSFCSAVRTVFSICIPSRSPTSQTVMRSGSFIPYHTPNHIGQNMFKHGCLCRNSRNRHPSRGSWSTAP